MGELAKRYAPLPRAADLAGPWRPDENRCQKLVSSLQSRLPGPPLWSEDQVVEFGSRVYVAVMAVWRTYGAGQAAGAGLGVRPEKRVPRLPAFEKEDTDVEENTDVEDSEGM
jgi:hypothetical protein